MIESIAGLRHTIAGARDLHAIMRTMKALAASRNGQYERSMRALEDYNRSVSIGLGECFRQTHESPAAAPPLRQDGQTIGVIVFRSAQGLVGAFNDVIAEHAIHPLAAVASGLEGKECRCGSEHRGAGLPCKDDLQPSSSRIETTSAHISRDGN